MIDETLYVIAVISNPVRYQSRIRLYKQFKHHMEQSANVKLITVETAFGERAFEVTSSEDPYQVQLRTYVEIWNKENMINIGIRQLYRVAPDWKYLAWIDADVHFTRPDWAIETIHQLQHHMIVQLFSTALDMTNDHQVMQTHRSFAWCWSENKFEPDLGSVVSGPYGENITPSKFYWHPGYAWAARRECIEALHTYSSGPLLDYPCIIGASDHHMALSILGLSERSAPKGIHQNYLKAVKIWEKNALLFIKKDIGYVSGTLTHYWHGKKSDRKYWQRWDILKNNDFDPETDITRDHQGLMVLEVNDERQRRLRDHLRGYFRDRNEDSIDL
jgi:hypothetical protein